MKAMGVFQFRARIGRDDKAVRKILARFRFQFTRPRGARPDCSTADIAKSVFQFTRLYFAAQLERNFQIVENLQKQFRRRARVLHGA